MLGKIDSSIGTEPRGQGVSDKGAPGAISGNPSFLANPVSPNVPLGDLEANLDFCSLRSMLVQQKEEIMRCIVRLVVGQGLIRPESYASHGKGVSTKPRRIPNGMGSVISPMGSGMHSRSPSVKASLQNKRKKIYHSTHSTLKSR